MEQPTRPHTNSDIGLWGFASLCSVLNTQANVWTDESLTRPSLHNTPTFVSDYPNAKAFTTKGELGKIGSAIGVKRVNSRNHSLQPELQDTRGRRHYSFTVSLDTMRREKHWVLSSTAGNDSEQSGLCLIPREVNISNNTLRWHIKRVEHTMLASTLSLCVIVPRGEKIQIVADIIKPEKQCDSRILLSLENFLYITAYRMFCLSVHLKRPIMLFLDSKLASLLLLYHYGDVYRRIPPALEKHTVLDTDPSTFAIAVKPITDKVWTEMTPVFTSVGYTFPESSGLSSSPNGQYGDVWYRLIIQKQESVMVSFPVFMNLPHFASHERFLVKKIQV